MSQVLGNLVSNALRATPQEGSIEVNVAVNDEDNIVYSVKDTGVGVDPSLAPLLFKDIVDFVPQNHDEEGGAGLGLWISFRIVQLHKGTMGFISPAPNGGSIFYFTLPVAEMVSGSTGSGRTMFRHRGSTFHRALQRITGSNFVLEPSSVHLQVPTTEERPSFHGSQSSDLPDNPPIGPPPPRAPSPAPSSAPSIANSQSFSSGISTPNDGSLIPSSTPRKTSHESVFGVVSTTLLHGEVRLRVLIVDDSKLNRKMMRRCLEDDFYVDEADDGSTAVERLQSRGVAAYDVISMDNMMPIMRGPMATSMIRALGFGGVIIGVTGNALPEEVVDFKENGGTQNFILALIDIFHFNCVLSQRTQSY